MTPSEIINLVEAGGTDRARNKIKKFALPERMKVLNSCIPHVNHSGKTLKFFKENFSKELGALITTNGNITQAVELYRNATK